MKLKEYLEQNNISKAEFGRQIGKHRATVLRYCNLERIPESMSLLIRIKELTGGEVSNFEDWLRESEECQMS